jgi:membrane protein implicated in regulation of membrane protease activity
MAASYTNQIGFILLFALVGIPSLFRSSRLTLETLFPLAVLIAFIPILGSGLYVSMLLAPFIAILGTMWIAKLLESSRRKFTVLSIIALLIVSSAALPMWSTQRWNEKEYPSGKTVSVDDQIFNDGTYLRVNFKGTTAISNVDTTTSELAAIGHATFLGSGIWMVLSGDVTREDIVRNLTWSAEPFPRNLYVWFEYPQQPNVDFFVFGLMITGVGFVAGHQSSATEYYLNHPKFVVAVDSSRSSEYVGFYSISNASFLTEIERSTTNANQEFSSYECYQTAGVTLYLVQLPF